MSSTAIGLAVLAERNLGSTTAGQGVPVGRAAAGHRGHSGAGAGAAAGVRRRSRATTSGGGWFEAARALAAIVAIIFGGRLLLRPALRWIARSDTPEIFTAASLLLVVATAALMQWVGLSMALGAFLAGVLLAESEYRRELETDLEPFKGLLLGLFFIAVGMGIDFAVVLRHPGLIVALVAGFLALKALVLWVMSRTMPIPLAERPVFVVLLAQGGEFGFVVFQTATQASVLDAESASLLVAVVALSMLLTPLLLVAGRPLVGRAPGCARQGSDHQGARRAAGGTDPDRRLRPLRPDRRPAAVCQRPVGHRARPRRRAGGRRAPLRLEGVLRRRDAAGPAARGRRGAGARAGGGDRRHRAEPGRWWTWRASTFRRLTIVARARNAQHWTQLYQRGVRLIERETLDSALMSARSVLEAIGYGPHRARTLALRFRRHSVEQLIAMAPHLGDEARLISISKAGRQQLEQLIAQERELAAKGRGGGWQATQGDGRLSRRRGVRRARPTAAWCR